jgi:Putative amidoligase enzyme
MRYSQIKPINEQRLDEINMSPASLRQLASKIEGAKAGLEFELVVRGLAGDDSDAESEPDYDSDESCHDIDEICEFFNDGDLNSSRDIRRLRERMQEDFYNWQSENLSDDFDNVDLPALLTSHFEDYDGLEGEELEQAVAAELDSPGRAYDIVREEWEDEARGNYTELDWLRAEGLRYMSDIENSYGISWPHYTTGSGGGDIEPEEAAESFSQAVGRPVKVSGGYHSSRRQEVGDEFYIAEPDASIEGDSDSDSGLEFVSPPLSISEMLADLKKVAAWCRAGNAYTNESTGLHMNVSVPNYSLERLDFIKLALLMGDEHVSESFGRLGAHYAKSAMAIIKRNIQNSPEKAKELLDQMRSHLNTAASKLIHTGGTQKFTSINVKDGRIEFRSPGGDWVRDFESGKVENTLLRFVVALDAAVDETKYRDEYAKKLYKILAPTEADASTIGYFAKYVAGEMPKAALKSFVKQAQTTRKIYKDLKKKVEAGVNQKYWWNVTTADGRNSIEIVAGNESEAKKAAAKSWGLDVNNPMVYSSYVAKPLRPYEDPASVPQEGNWGIWAAIPQQFAAMSTSSTVLRRFKTAAEAQAWLESIRLNPDRFEVREIPADYTHPRSNTDDQTAGTAYEIYNRDTDQVVHNYRAAGPIPAFDAAVAYVQQHGLSSREFNFRTVDAGNDARRARQSAQNTTPTPGTMPPRAAELPPATTQTYWHVFGDNGQFVSVPARDEQEAQNIAARRYGAALGDPGNFRITRIEA